MTEQYTSEFIRENVFAHPHTVLEIGQALVTELGVTSNYETHPEVYIAELRERDPRSSKDEKGKPVWTTRKVMAGQPLLTSAEQADLVMDTASHLGLLVPSYPFDDFASMAEKVVITGGVHTALENAGEFAINSIISSDIPVVIAEGDRPLNAAELAWVEEQGLDPKQFNKGYHAAEIVANKLSEKYPNNNISHYEIRTVGPQAVDIVRETFLSNPKLSRLALSASAQMYVPFISMYTSLVTTELGNKVTARVYAGESNPEKIAARTVDNYRSEVLRTLAGAARWQMAKSRRGSK